MMMMDEAQTRETANGTVVVYGGGSYLYEDIVYEDENRSVFLPAGNCRVADFFSTEFPAGISPRSSISYSASGRSGIMNFELQFVQRPFLPICALLTSIEVEQTGQLIRICLLCRDAVHTTSVNACCIA